MSGENLALVYLTLAKLTTYVGLFALTGACLLRLAIGPRAARSLGPETPVPDAWTRRVQTVATGGAWLVALAALTRLYAQTYSTFGLDESIGLDLVRVVALESRWGGRWRPQAVAAGLAVVAAVWMTLRPRSSGAWWVVAASVAGIVVTLPLTGHAMAMVGSARVSWALQVGHLLAAAAWLGTLAALVMGVLAMVGVGGLKMDVDRWIAALVHVFSPLAVVAVGGVLLTGVWTAALYLDRVDALWGTNYGRVLLLKSALFVAAGAAGAYNWRRVRPRLGRAAASATLLRSAGLELLIAAVLLLVTGLLVHLPLPGD